jgi:hypothetical protein
MPSPKSQATQYLVFAPTLPRYAINTVKGETIMSELGKTLWKIADELRGSMNADDFRDYMLSFN